MRVEAEDCREKIIQCTLDTSYRFHRGQSEPVVDRIIGKYGQQEYRQGMADYRRMKELEKQGHTCNPLEERCHLCEEYFEIVKRMKDARVPWPS